MDQRTGERYPATWEANLLVAVLLLTVVAGAGTLALALPLSAVLVIGQILFVVPLVVWMAVRRLPLRATLGLHPISAPTGLWSVLVGVACWPVVAGLVTFLARPLEAIGPYPAPPPPTSGIERAAYALTFIVIAPLTEEPAFRGFVMHAWLRRGTRAGILVSGLLFGLLHSQIAPLLPVTLLGIVLGLVAFRSGSTLGTILAHAGYNAAATLFIVVPALQGTQDAVFITAGLAALPVAALLVYLFVRRHPRQSSPADLPPRETGPWRWPILTLLVVVGLFGLMAVLEIVLRLQPDLGGLAGG